MYHIDEAAESLVHVVLPDMSAPHPRQALSHLAKMTGPYISVDTRIIEQRLFVLEQQEGSGIGNGVALPHLRLSGADRAIAFFARNRPWLNFHTVDNTLVDLICCLVSPVDTAAAHLRRLSRITRVLRNNTTLDMLRAAENRNVIEMILTSNYPGQFHAA